MQTPSLFVALTPKPVPERFSSLSHDVNYQQTYVMGLSFRSISRGNRRHCPAIQVGD